MDEGISLLNNPEAKLLILILDSLKPCDTLTGMTEPIFSVFFKDFINRFELDDQYYKPYSPRRGGATAHWQMHRNYTLTQALGRWNDASLQILHAGRSAFCSKYVSTAKSRVAKICKTATPSSCMKCVE